MNPLSDQKIIDSWRKNVNPWIQAINQAEIESRILVTNQAIVEAIVLHNPQSVLDVGCGEGWLIRRISKEGIMGMGIDIVPEFIEYASNQGVGTFKTVAYEDFSFGSIGQTFDVIVCNFSLLGKKSVEQVFLMAPQLLNEGGVLIIQTIHPVEANGSHEYLDGWKMGSWKGFSDQFTDPAPWYFRTIDSWKKLFFKNSFADLQMKETMHPESEIRLSVIITGKKISPEDSTPELIH